MSRIFVFVLGVGVGVFGHFAALNYHLVRAEDGFHVIPKISSRLTETYVDIRQFDLSDWNEHKTLAAAIVREDKTGLLKDAADTSLQNSLNTVVNVLSGT